MVRQKEERKDRRCDCLLLCPFEGERFRSRGHIVDISYGGAGIRGTRKLPPEGTELLLTTRHTWKAAELRSKVVWVKSEAKEPGLADFGVEFLDTLRERQEKLATFIPKTNTIG